MWTCPDCGRSFANKNQWHACQDTTVDQHLAGKTALATSIYESVVLALERAGEFRIHPQQTRIAFISRMTFAGVALARKWADLSFILPQPLDDPRVRRLEPYGPTSWGHSVRLYQPDDVDEGVGRWLAEALRRGSQETLDPAAEVLPLTGRQLEVLASAFSAKVEHDRVALPRHVAEALSLVDIVSVRVGGVEYETALERGESGTYLAVDATTGLGAGDETDVFLKVVG